MAVVGDGWEEEDRGGRFRGRFVMVVRVFTAEEALGVGKAIGIQFGVIDLEQFRRGLAVELEHGARALDTNVTNDDLMTTGRIALAHLREIPDYYTRLERMERELEAVR